MPANQPSQFTFVVSGFFNLKLKKPPYIIWISWFTLVIFGSSASVASTIQGETWEWAFFIVAPKLPVTCWPLLSCWNLRWYVSKARNRTNFCHSPMILPHRTATWSKVTQECVPYYLLWCNGTSSASGQIVLEFLWQSYQDLQQETGPGLSGSVEWLEGSSSLPAKDRGLPEGSHSSRDKQDLYTINSFKMCNISRVAVWGPIFLHLPGLQQVALTQPSSCSPPPPLGKRTDIEPGNA